MIALDPMENKIINTTISTTTTTAATAFTSTNKNI